MSQKVLFIGDTSNWSNIAAKFIKEQYEDPLIVLWEHGDKYPYEIDSWKGDLIFSFKSDLILGTDIIKNADVAAINFHPCPPKYRGIGGYTYAIYNEDTIFGITCHYMDHLIDHGNIIDVLCFPIFPFEKASSLKIRAGAYCLTQLYDIIYKIRNLQKLPCTQDVWGNKLYTRKEFEKFILEIDDKTHRCIL